MFLLFQSGGIFSLLSQWLTFKLLGIPYLVGKIKFKLLFQGPLAKWVRFLVSFRGCNDQFQTFITWELHNFKLLFQGPKWLSHEPIIEMIRMWSKNLYGTTVDGWNPAPPGMYKTL